MNAEYSLGLASGYAWGREDATKVRTATTDDRDGSYLFAGAYAAAQDDYNTGRRGSMMPVRDAYAAWQETGGRTIEDKYGFEAHLIGQARVWLARFPAYAGLTDQAVREGIDRHYPGGWASFRSAEQAGYYRPAS